MTGCPAFYDLRYLKQTKCERQAITKICVSDNSLDSNSLLLLSLLKYLRKNYPQSKIVFVIHREIKDSIQKLLDTGFFRTLDIYVKHIADSDVFSVYDDCSLHIGFRVHAHIYNLSRRKISILINEDIRGYGINIILGLENIPIQKECHIYYRKCLKTFCNRVIAVEFYKENGFAQVFRQIDSMLEMIESGDLSAYESAFFRMKRYWKNMEQHLTSIFTAIK